MIPTVLSPRTLAALALAALLASPAFSQEATDDATEGMATEGMAMGDGETVTMTNGMEMAAMAPMTDEAMRPFMVPMDTMMAAMPMASAGMPDADFLLMMIPHHQSAIDMAMVELEMGQDDATKAMAQEIIDAQEAEIAEMRAMLEGMGVEAPAMPME